MTEELKIECPYCNRTTVKKNGRTKKGKPRYLCKYCGKTFVNVSKYKINKKARLALGVLYNLLHDNFYKTDSLRSVLQKSCKEETEKTIEDFEFDGEIAGHSSHVNNINFKCRNPKLLICLDDNKIKLIKIHPPMKDQKRPSRSIVIHDMLR